MPTKQKARKAPTSKPVSPELPADDDEERLTDLRHVDELDCMVKRMRGLQAAVLGVCDSDTPFDHGLYQLATDITDAMEACADAFEAACQLRKTTERTK